MTGELSNVMWEVGVPDSTERAERPQGDRRACSCYSFSWHLQCVPLHPCSLLTFSGPRGPTVCKCILGAARVGGCGVL